MMDTEETYYRSPKEKTNNIEEDYEDDKNEDDIPMALIVEDDLLCQSHVINELKSMNIRYRTATTVSEAKNLYHDLAQEGISIDIVFLDLLLKDGSRGIDFLKMIRQNHWMEKALILVMSGYDDTNVVSQCYEYQIQNFIKKPISKQSFLEQKHKIKIYLNSIKCPIAGYKIEKQIGSGASAIVYLVQHKKSKEFYAMKKVILQPGHHDTNIKEALYHKKIKAPTVIGFKESQFIGDDMYMVLEYAAYGTINNRIHQKIKENSRFDTEEILDWITMIFIGLFVIHKKGVIHRDIKSENLFLCESDVVKIGDLGIARGAVNAQTICGTALYMAPEMYMYQPYNSKVDIWATGIVLYELAMLKKPFEKYNEDETKKLIIACEYEVLPDTDSRIKRLLSLTLAPGEKRAEAKQLLSLPFIHERVVRLFKTKLNDDALFRKISSIGVLPPNARLPLENCIDSLESKEYYKYFYNSSILNAKIPKTFYKPSLFSWTIYDVIDSYYIQYPDEEMKITSKDIQDLLKEGLLIEMIGKKGKYYKINIFEKEWIDNSINLPIDKNIIAEDSQFPMKLSAEALTLVFDLWSELRCISDDEQKIEFRCSQKLFDFYMVIKRLSKLPIHTYDKNTKLAIMLNLYQTMYLHYIIKYLLYEEMLQKMSFVNNIISLFFLHKNNIEIIYEIDDCTLSLFELKHIVMRRNKTIPHSFFKAAYSSDPRLNFIDESMNPSIEFMLQIHCICSELPRMVIEEDLLQLEPIISCFNDNSLEEDMTCHVKKFIRDNITVDDHNINLPIVFKQYLNDFGGNEYELLTLLLKYYFSENEKKEQKMTMTKLSQGFLTIDYPDMNQE